MIIEIIIAIILGCIAGTITGLIPGIHINLVALLIVSSSSFLLEFTSPLTLGVFIISMSILHTFMDSCPSIFLGAPEESTVLAVLPGHKLLLKGRGYEAVKLTVIGSLFGLIMTIALAVVLITGVGKIYPFINKYILYILIASSIFLIIKDKKSRIWALIIFLMAGCLGLGSLNITSIRQPLFPLLSGLFGTSGLFLSLKDKIKIPKQTLKSDKINKKEISKSLSAGFIASTLSGFLPGLGAAQAAIIASSVFKKNTTRGFLILVGSINTIIMVLSFIALFVIDKARNGAIVAVSKIIPNFTQTDLILFLVVSLTVAGIATILTLNVAKIFSKFMSKINYSRLCLGIISLITLLVLIISGPLGLLVLIISTCVGIIPPLKGVGRNHLMGCLILPVILYFSPINFLNIFF